MSISSNYRKFDYMKRKNANYTEQAVTHPTKGYITLHRKSTAVHC